MKTKTKSQSISVHAKRADDTNGSSVYATANGQANQADPHSHRIDKSATPKKYRSVFISDVHLGTKDSKADFLCDFLKESSAESVYLVGDIFDGWRMRKRITWKKSFNRVLRRILKMSKRGTPVYYITGNHDEFLRRFANNSFDNIHLVNRAIHITAQNKKLLVIHGDQFENMAKCPTLLKHIGDVGYGFLMNVNRICNGIRLMAGYDYWSFSGFLKSHIKRAQKYILHYEEAAAKFAKQQKFDGIVCGHIHHAAQKTINGVSYLNTGDWVESCTAIVEHHDGRMELLYWFEQETYLQKTSLHTKVKRKTPLPPPTQQPIPLPASTAFPPQHMTTKQENVPAEHIH